MSNLKATTTTIHIDASRALEPLPNGVSVYTKEIIEHLAAVISEAKIILYAPIWRQGVAAQVFSDLPTTVTWKFLGWPPKFLWTQARLAVAWWCAACDEKSVGLSGVNSVVNVFFAPAHVAPWFSPKNLVVVAHDVAFVTVPAAYSFFERIFARIMTTRNCVRARRVITPSEKTKQDLQKYFNISANKIFVTPFAAPCRIMPAKKNIDVPYVNNEPERGVGAPIILFVGRIEYKKGIDRLVEAFEQMSAVARLVLVGKPGIGYDKMRARVLISPKCENIEERGFVSDEELIKLYQTAAVFALPSRAEGFGFILLEAFSRGVPVVAWNAGSISEIVGKAAVLVSNTASYAAALDKVVSDTAFADTLRLVGAARVAEFSWQKTAQKTARILLDGAA